MIADRRKTKEVRVGRAKIGGNNPVLVQSMCSTKTTDVDSTLKQIQGLEDVGCEIVRLAVPDLDSAKCFGYIKKRVSLPLVADVHYDYKIALECLKQGADKVRVNPGNIPKEKLKLIVEAAKDSGTPIRIGVNTGSLPNDAVKKFGHGTKAVVEAALDTLKLFESLDFYNTVVSLKSSDVLQNIEANELFSRVSDYPLHLGVTEAGTARSGVIKSSISIGYLLMEGIGDTIRISLTADPVEEVLAGHTLLRTLRLREGAVLVSCPTCGRSKLEVIKIANEVEKMIMRIEKPLKVGVMGCFVNVDEAKMADIGVAGSDDSGIIFKDGKLVRKVDKDKLVEELMEEVGKYYQER